MWLERGWFFTILAWFIVCLHSTLLRVSDPLSPSQNDHLHRAAKNQYLLPSGDPDLHIDAGTLGTVYQTKY